MSMLRFVLGLAAASLSVTLFNFSGFAAEYSVDVTVNDAEKGSVSASSVVIPDGGLATITATPAEGYGFTRWTGDVDPAVCLNPTITVKGDGVKSLCANFGKTYLVDGAYGNDATTDGTNPATPYKTINAALAQAGAFDKIVAVAGKYAEGKTWELDKAVVLSGVGSSQTIVSGCKIKMNCADAVLADLRVTGWSSAGAVEFVKDGAGGTLVRCDVSGNTRTSTDGTGIAMYCGNLIDCTITNNVNSAGGRGVGVNVSASGDCLLENCLIADNMVGGSTGGVGGLYITTSNVNGKRVVLRHCTIVGNSGGDVGGLYVSGNLNFVMTDCLIADNFKLKAATASNTEDAYLGWSGGYTRGVTNCLIAKCPTYDAKYQVENCITNIAAGMYQPYARDYSVGSGSAAWGAASDGTDIGCFQTEHGDSFAVGCYAEADRGVGSVTTVLHGTAVNSDGAVTYEWDLDGDGTYETSGATVEATFAEIGWNSVNVKATCGGESIAATVEHVVCVFAPTTHVWTKSPNPTFPYATWETAATDPYVGLAATIDGGKLQFTNEMVLLTKPMQVARRIEMCGTGKENNSVNSSPLHWTLKNFEDVNATGTSIQRKGSSDVVLLRLFNEGATVHSIAYGPGRNRDLEIYGESVISNCTVRYGSFTAGDGCGVWMNAGLVTHCVISNNYCSNDSTKGVQLHMEGTAKLRNSLVVNGCADSAGSNGGCKGAIWASGSNVQIENCTISGNTAGKGGGVYTVGAVTVRNCIIRDNSAMLTDNDIFVESGTPVFENCCLAEKRGTGCQTGQPGFIIDEAGRNTWTFSAASPCVNNGAPVAWATENATDYFGNKRVQGEAIDIGCFEADLSKATCDIEVSEAEIVGGAADVTFSVKLVGATLPEDAVCKWDFDGDGVYEREGRSLTLHCEEGFHTASLKVMKGDETLYEVDGKSDLVTVYPTVIYFNGANVEGAAFPYNTTEKAAAKMSDVLSAAKSGVDIRVCEGVHDCDVQILLNFKCTLHPAEGVTSRPRLVRKFDGNSFISVANDEALIEGLDLDDNKYYTFNVNQNAGTIRDCVIRNGYYTSGSGIGITMNGGLVDRCEIVGTRGTSEQSYSGRGLALHLSGTAVVRNSLIRGNFADSATAGRRGGLISVEGNAVLESCTITGNTNRQENVICTFGTGTVRNCIIFGNECGQENALGSPYFPAYAPMVASDIKLVGEGVKTADFDYNCYTSATAYGEHDIIADPKFRIRKGRRYCLSSGSPCIEAGAPCAWMEEPGVADFYGNPRRYNAKPDIGCVESQVGGLLLRVK